MTSIVIPAHNEERVIGRLLDALLADGAAGGTDIVVVCNGCTDGTAAVAGARGERVRVVEIPVPSKHEALRTGDAHARGFPRLYVDADVVIGAADVRALADALTGAGEPGGSAGGAGEAGAAGETAGNAPAKILAAAPARDIPLAGCAWRVRAYYRVWQRLPAVREGLFGRGVIAVSEEGYGRIAALPPLMADDLAASLAFGPDERLVVDAARVVVHPPRTWGDLIRRRIRSATSSAQLESAQGQGPDRPSARTSKADLLGVVRREPRLLPGVVVFLAVALAARRGSGKAIRDQDFGTWLRDESSRQG
ncbi:glycosyltransferase family 2 protein [Streptomyces sp. NPDC051976]|uniref:glycosyltransferase n=1 Tax=Streptomyces sp. NPDC051976 TaxID=3154947 RepID=UPI00343A5E84